MVLNSLESIQFDFKVIWHRINWSLHTWHAYRNRVSKIGIKRIPCDCVDNQIAFHCRKNVSSKYLSKLLESWNFFPSAGHIRAGDVDPIRSVLGRVTGAQQSPFAQLAHNQQLLSQGVMDRVPPNFHISIQAAAKVSSALRLYPCSLS